MKRNLVFIAFLIILTACSKENVLSLRVENNSAIDRNKELVEIDWKIISEKLQTADIVVLDAEGNELASQIIFNGKEAPESLVFPATVSANSYSEYTLKEGLPQKEHLLRTYGRAIPERKDDFAWENDRVVYRVYGPALANENPSNGIDLWLKKTNNMVINKFYENDLQKGISYHVDHGEGLDCYKVGHTLGAGAITPFVDGKIWIQNHYTTAKILDTGLLRTTFELTYDSVAVAGKVLKEKLTVSLDAGSQFNKATVSYSGDIEKMELVAGFFLHSEIGDITSNKEEGYIAYAENVVSDAGVPAGRSYLGVIFTTPVQKIFQDNEHIAGIVGYKKGESLTYYFGSGWNQWGFETDKDWLNEMNRYTEVIKSPLIVKTIE